MLFRIGTCSWKYDSWRGLIYPESGKLNYLKEYSEKLDTVEIDQWFWSLFGKDSIKLPVTETVREYNDSVNEDFRFTIKVPNAITLTHYYSHGPGGAETIPGEKNPFFLSIDVFNLFLETLEPIKNKTGVLLFQFEYLNRQKMISLNELLDRLSVFFNKCSKEIPIAIELRNPNYLKKNYFNFLKEQNLSNVFIQGYYMPDIASLYGMVKSDIENLTVIRLIGPDRKKIEEKTKKKWDKIVSPKDDDLRNIADILKDLESRGIKVFLNINNHYEGSAPLTIRKIKEILEK